MPSSSSIETTPIVSSVIDLVLLHSRSNAHLLVSRAGALRATPRERCSPKKNAVRMGAVRCTCTCGQPRVHMHIRGWPLPPASGGTLCVARSLLELIIFAGFWLLAASVKICGGHEGVQSQCRLPLVAADGGPRGVDDLLQERILFYCIDSDDMTESATTRAGRAEGGYL